MSPPTLGLVLAQSANLIVLAGLLGLRWPAGFAVAVLWLEVAVVAVCMVIRARRQKPAESDSVPPAGVDPTLWRAATVRLQQYKRRLRWGFVSMMPLLGLVAVVALARHAAEPTLSAITVISAFLVIGSAGLVAVRMIRCSNDGSVGLAVPPAQVLITRPVEKTEWLRAVIVVIAVFLGVLIPPGPVGWNEYLEFGGRKGPLLEIVVQGTVAVIHTVMGFFVPFISSVSGRVTVGLVLIKIILDVVILRRSARSGWLPMPFFHPSRGSGGWFGGFG